MTPIVMKFGGASVATPESFHHIAEIIAKRKQIEKRPIVVVVSAMADATDRLLALARQIHPSPPARELDMLISTGERISIALLAMALALKGIDAVSFTGSQSGMITDESHSDAKIVAVRPSRILAAFQANQVAIVAGFQGVSRSGEITTLGRGGSDTSAVALAIGLDAAAVDFYKDVAGIYETDPKLDPNARLLSSLDYASAEHLAMCGAKVLHARSIALARKNGVALNIRSFHAADHIGTIVGSSTAQRPAELKWEL